MYLKKVRILSILSLFFSSSSLHSTVLIEEWSFVIALNRSFLFNILNGRRCLNWHGLKGISPIFLLLLMHPMMNSSLYVAYLLRKKTHEICRVVDQRTRFLQKRNRFRVHSNHRNPSKSSVMMSRYCKLKRFS